MKAPNPFLALQPYDVEDSSRLFGRDEDLSLMRARLLAAKTTLLFAGSGVGKTSFLNAKLVPNLRPRFFVVCHRDWSTEEPLSAVAASIVKSLHGRAQTDTDHPASLGALFDAIKRADEEYPDRAVLILDQFEELFQYYRDTPELRNFALAVAELANTPDREIRIILSMREDFLGELSIFDNLMPDPFHNYYRLKNPNREQASEIIERTASLSGVPVSEDGLELLVADLTSGPLDVKSGKRKQTLREYVHPPYLQIVCHRLWAEADLKGRPFLANYSAGVARTELKRYCNERLDQLSDTERDLARTAFGFLMTKRGAKMAYEIANLSEHMAVPQDSLERMLRMLSTPAVRILRETRGPDGSQWFELYHDMYAPFLFAWKSELDARRAEQLKQKETELRQRAEQLETGVEQSLKTAREQIDLYRKLADKDPATNLPELARSLVNLAVTLGRASRIEEARQALDETLTTSRAALKLTDQQSPQIAWIMVAASACLGEMGLVQECIAVCDEIVACFGEVRDETVREQVSAALFNKGLALTNSARQQEAVAAYDEVVSRFGSFPDASLREEVAKSLVSKAIALGELGLALQEAAVCDEVVQRFGEAAEPELREQVARALVNKGIALTQLKRSEDANAVYDDVLRRYGESTEPSLREQVGMALLNKGLRLIELDRIEEGLAAYEEVLQRYRESTELALREQVAEALLNKAITLGTLGRSEEEIAIYNEVVQRYGDSPKPELGEQAAKALLSKGVALSELKRGEEAIDSYNEVIQRYGESPELALREQVAKALVNKGIGLSDLGRAEEEIAEYDEVLRRYSEAQETDLCLQVASALSFKGITLGQLGRNQEAIRAYDEVQERYGHRQERELRQQVGKALVSKAFILDELDRPEDEMGVYDQVIERYLEDSALNEQTGKALFFKAITLEQLGRTEDSINAYDLLIQHFGDAPESEVREYVAQAELARAELAAKLKSSGDRAVSESDQNLSA